jgi:hypothetical protein
MLVAIVDIPYYDQLRRVSPATLEAVSRAITRWSGGPLPGIGERRGRYLFGLSGENGRDLPEAFARIEALRRDLDAAEVGSHLCLVFESVGREIQDVEREAERLLARLEAASWSEEPPGLPPAWRRATVVHASAATGIRPLVELQGAGEFLTPIPARLPAQPASRERPSSAAPSVARPNATHRIVEAAFASLEEGSGTRFPVLVSGPDGVGKARAARDAALVIVGPAWSGATVSVHTLFGRKSAIHPFLNSIRADLLDELPRHLRPWELAVWKERERLFRALASSWAGDAARSSEASLFCPDRLSVDFYCAYRLYLLGYVRAMESRCVPAVALFEDIHTYHPEALRFTASVVHDLLRLDSFVPILTCRGDHDACGVFGTDVLAVRLHAVSLDEIRGVAQSMYPGLNLPEKAARRIRSLGGGRLGPVGHYLRHLERSGKIQGEAGRFAWVAGAPARLPTDGSRAAWGEIEALSRPARELLYLCALSGGILPVSETLGLAVSLDTPPTEARAMESRIRDLRADLLGLERAGLIRGADVPVFLFSALKARLAESLGGWAARARTAFSDSLERAWRSGHARHLVLAFSVLRADRLDVALDILDTLVTRKLDELNVRGCHFFLDPAKLRADVGATEGQRERYARMAATGELRSHLLLGAWERAERAMDRVSNLEIPDDRPGDLARRALEQSRFHLVKAEAPAAAKAAKTAAILFHDASEERGERRAEAELGAALLAEGRLEEALEYFGFVTRATDCDPFPRVRAASLASIASYLLGNLSASVRLAEEAERLAQGAARREWQAFMVFFRARHHFDLGQFDEAVSVLEGLLAFTRLYGMERARAVATAWMGRSLAYAGRPVFASELLQRLGDTPEVRFFRAEGLFLLGQVQPALRLLESDGLGTGRQSMQPGERVSWESGFASIEERCSPLRRDGGTLLRLIRGFRAYLTALDGRPEQASRELYRITRVERVSDADPYLPLYGYWYAATLPEENEQGKGSDHRLTVLNKAMKQLQQRSSRIESARDRWQLMTANYWNARLLAEAKSRRLV